MASFGDALTLIINTFNNHNKTENNTVSPCIETISHQKFYLFSLLPAVLITISLGLSKQRRHLFLDYFNGRPGIVYPMDITTRSNSMSYSAAFAATLHLLFLVIFNGKNAFVNSSTGALNKLLKLGSTIVYGMVFFPVFACLAIGSTYGYAIGSVYIWVYTAVSMFEILQCVYTYEYHVIVLVVFRNVPQFISMLYLCCSIPGRFIKSFRKHKNWFETNHDGFKTETLADIKESFAGLHVRNLLKRPKPEPKPPTGAFKTIVWKFWNRWVYKLDPSFQYSSRFQSVMFVGVFLIYMLSFEFIALGERYAQLCIKYIKNIQAMTEDTNKVYELDKLIYWTYAFETSLIISVVIAMLLNFIFILHMTSSYRNNLRDLHRGYHTVIPPTSMRSTVKHLIGSMKYAGYQIGYIAWGFAIQVIVFLPICIVFGYTNLSYYIFIYVWPYVFSAIIIHVLQRVVAKFVFLQERGLGLAFDNRRLLFSFTYFMFFYNIFLGLFSCLLRILKTTAVGILLMTRLDYRTLPHRFQFLDSGFAAYVGFMNVENSQNHPVVLILVRMFLVNLRNNVNLEFVNIGNTIGTNDGVGNSSIMDSNIMRPDVNRRRKAAIINWHVTYTLINNPGLRFYRKRYLQDLKKTNDEGVVPLVSDHPISDPNLLTKLKRRVKSTAVRLGLQERPHGTLNLPSSDVDYINC